MCVCVCVCVCVCDWLCVCVWPIVCVYAWGSAFVNAMLVNASPWWPPDNWIAIQLAKVGYTILDQHEFKYLRVLYNPGTTWFVPRLSTHIGFAHHCGRTIFLCTQTKAEVKMDVWIIASWNVWSLFKMWMFYGSFTTGQDRCVCAYVCVFLSSSDFIGNYWV